jgi:hypothetical protein
MRPKKKRCSRHKPNPNQPRLAHELTHPVSEHPKHQRGSNHSPNASSGYAIRLLQDSDRTLHQGYQQAIEKFVEESAAMRVLFASHYVLEPRVWGIDDLANPADANEQTSALEALRKGGNVAIRIVESSGTPRTPEAQDEEVRAYFDAGLLGDPADQDVQRLVLTLLHNPAASRALEELRQLDEKKAAMQMAQELEGGGEPEEPPMDPMMDPAMMPMDPMMDPAMMGAPPMDPALAMMDPAMMPAENVDPLMPAAEPGQMY